MIKARLHSLSSSLESTETPSCYQMTRDKLIQDPDFDLVFEEVYGHLRRMAASLRRRERYSTLSTIEIVNELYLKLVGSPALAVKGADYLKRIAAIAMRQILIDAAHRRRSLKRGGGLIRVTLSDVLGVSGSWDEVVLDLDRYLNEFSLLDPRAAEVVELHFFGGFTVPETAVSLGISESSVARDLRSAIAWLKLKMRPEMIVPPARRSA